MTERTAVQDACPSVDRLTVYFDGSCPLCSAEIGLYRRLDHDGRVVFDDVAARDAAPAPDLTHRDALARFHVRLPDGRLLSGAAAFAALWRTMPGVWRALGAIAARRPFVWILEGVYRAFLPVRPSLSRMARRLRAGEGR